jgi:HAD superfamily hydrolase (TIGR01493 family)
VPIKVLTFDVFGTLLDYSACPWIKQYAEEVSLVRSGAKPYRVLSEIFEEIGADWTRLTVKPGVIEGLARLSRTFAVVPLSNANYDLIYTISKHFQLPWDFYIDVKYCRCFKPEPKFYCSAIRDIFKKMGSVYLEEHICHVAAHPYDLIGAQRMGFKTAFIDWDADPLTSPANFDYTTPDFLTLVNMLEASP